MDPSMIVEWVIKSVVILLVMTAGFAYVTLFERRVIAKFQVRIGPNRAGPGGILQPVADGIKLIFKEELIPDKADKIIFILAPILTVIPALIITAVVPWGGTINLFGRQVALQLADLNVGVLYIMAVTSISVYGITLAGWASNNKYATMGGLRSTAQMISYEIAMGFSFIVPVLLAGSMSLLDIVNAQKDVWFILLQPGAAVILFISMLAETNRAPFDMPEAEQELTAGYLTEYSGMKFALFFMAEYIKMIAVSMIFASLFLGGFYLPFQGALERAVPGLRPILPYLGPLVLFAKVVFLLYVFVWVRATLPRIRYDRLMALGWKVTFPLALLSVLVTAAAVLLVGG
ncbi:MAG: NADH-quinone oxidoreductase subunit NuoH [Chloroflexi bacterium]|nr:NADH-quinone oxidoreductase subunit NuoH [Chloroflexota bacterium]